MKKVFYVMFVLSVFALTPVNGEKKIKEKIVKISTKKKGYKALKYSDLALPDTINPVTKQRIENRIAKQNAINKAIENSLVFNSKTMLEEFPELVTIKHNGDTVINYIMLIPVLFEQVKEQQLAIDELQKQIK